MESMSLLSMSHVLISRAKDSLRHSRDSLASCNILELGLYHPDPVTGVVMLLSLPLRLPLMILDGFLSILCGESNVTRRFIRLLSRCSAAFVFYIINLTAMVLVSLLHLPSILSDVFKFACLIVVGAVILVPILVTVCILPVVVSINAVLLTLKSYVFKIIGHVLSHLVFYLLGLTALMSLILPIQIPAVLSGVILVWDLSRWAYDKNSGYLGIFGGIKEALSLVGLDVLSLLGVSSAVLAICFILGLALVPCVVIYALVLAFFGADTMFYSEWMDSKSVFKNIFSSLGANLDDLLDSFYYWFIPDTPKVTLEDTWHGSFSSHYLGSLSRGVVFEPFKAATMVVCAEEKNNEGGKNVSL
ncbi:MAG: hypothetical protein ACON5A_01315 [Candidatus Comchoanobacterales bacterium]